MYSDLKITLFAFLLFTACSPYGRIQSMRDGNVMMEIAVPDEEPVDDCAEAEIDSMRRVIPDEPFIMNAIRDTETGEMVATDIINASKVVARFRNVAERGGAVDIGFDIIVPAEMLDSRWSLKIYPVMVIQSDSLTLNPVFITGSDYREKQLRGYQRYRKFIASIITDTTDFVRIGQLEIFLKRNFPDTYAMKTDSSFVSDDTAESLFGVTMLEASRHYTRKFRKFMNERRKSRVHEMYERYVKDPLDEAGVRLDTVLASSDGGFIYRYSHSFRSRPGLKKVTVTLRGTVYEMGEYVCSLPFPHDVTYYISSLSTLADISPRYLFNVIERRVYDYTKAFIDFKEGSAEVDTLLGGNLLELRRIRRCFDDMTSSDEYALDSLVITASCSPEGSYASNARLSAARSASVCEYLKKYVSEDLQDSLVTSCNPENWGQLRQIVQNDTALVTVARERIMELTSDLSYPDAVERRLSSMSEYRYLREKIYPKLRTVSFEFYLHRKGMDKDTVHTTVLDTSYMAGLEALRNLDYKVAVEKLRPYRDYNAALAFTSAGYNHSALDILNRLDDHDARVCYLKAVVLARLGLTKEAVMYLDLSIAYEPSMRHRANLDPELSELINELN